MHVEESKSSDPRLNLEELNAQFESRTQLLSLLSREDIRVVGAQVLITLKGISFADNSLKALINKGFIEDRDGIYKPTTLGQKMLLGLEPILDD